MSAAFFPTCGHGTARMTGSAPGPTKVATRMVLLRIGMPDMSAVAGGLAIPLAPCGKTPEGRWLNIRRCVEYLEPRHARQARRASQTTPSRLRGVMEARRAGSADLPLHGGAVPKWLADRMTRLGAVISEAIVHHYGRDELLRRLAHPFWFQSFGAVMGMDWHSSGITTSVEAWLGPAREGARPPHLWRAREVFAADPARAGCDRGAGRVRPSRARHSQPTGGKGRQ